MMLVLFRILTKIIILKSTKFQFVLYSIKIYKLKLINPRTICKKDTL